MRSHTTVIIPHYNNTNTIIATLKSVLNQTLAAEEIIVVDDGSEDVLKLESIIGNLDPEQAIIKLIRNEKNQNGAVCRNIGIDHAKGDTVAFLDADDEWKVDKLEKAQIYIHEHPDQIFYSPVDVYFDSEFKYTRPITPIETGVPMCEYLFLKDGFVQTSTIVCTTKVARKVKFNPLFKRHQDYDFCIRAHKMGIKFHMYPRSLAMYHNQKQTKKLKRETSNFSREWIDLMRPYMSNDGYWGFRLFNLNARYLADRLLRQALVNFVISVWKLGPTGLRKTIKKITGIVRRAAR